MVCVSSLVFFFFFLAASSITYLSALRFPYREGADGGFVFFFFSTYLLYLVPLLVAVPYRESVCLFVGGAGMGLHTMTFFCLVSVFVHLAASVRLCFRPLGAFPRIFNILVRHTSIPLFPRGTWSFPIARACVCLRAGRCGVHTLFFLVLVSVFSLLAVLFMCVRVCVVRPFGALPRIVNILARRTVVSSWLVNVRLFAFSLVPLCPWPPHTFCAFVEFFFFFAAVGAYGGINMGDIWLWFVFAGVPFDVRGGSSFFLFFFFACGVVPWAPSFATYLVFSSTYM